METKKLTCRDLMIGDWVYRPDCYDKVVEVRKDTILGSDPLRGLIPIADLQPIPLTAEILEKNGFTRLGTNYILEGEHFGLDNPSNPNNYLDNYWLRISINAVKIEYVEQLQHALRLCGINDKEIVL